jgi:hypothetical protein
MLSEEHQLSILHWTTVTTVTTATTSGHSLNTLYTFPK